MLRLGLRASLGPAITAEINVIFTGFQFCLFTITVFVAYKKNKKLSGCNYFNTIIFPFDVKTINHGRKKKRKS